MAVRLVCASDERPEEVHLVATGISSRVHPLVVQGLLADHPYTCTLQRDDADRAFLGAVSVRTLPLPEPLPPWTVTRDPSFEMSGAYTLFNESSFCDMPNRNHLYIVDPDGEIRWYHELEEITFIDIDASYLGDGELWIGGGHGINLGFGPDYGLLRRMDLSLDVKWEQREPTVGYSYHHDVEPDAGGEALTMTWDEATDGDRSGVGFALERIGVDDPTPTWTWRSQQAVDEGSLTISDAALDLWHPNAAEWVEDDAGPSAWVSLWESHRIVRIDAATGAITWQLGVDGDFTLTDQDGQPAGDEDWFYNQHAPEVHFPRLLLYDNGAYRPGEPYSRALELELDTAARTARITWSYTEPGWLELAVGDLDELPGDHVLIAMGHCACCEPTGAEHGSALVEVDKATGANVWRLDMDDLMRMPYRAERIDGCAIFSNAAWCDEVAAELGGS